MHKDIITTSISNPHVYVDDQYILHVCGLCLQVVLGPRGLYCSSQHAQRQRDTCISNLMFSG